jgi:hypothetical protein
VISRETFKKHIMAGNEASDGAEDADFGRGGAGNRNGRSSFEPLIKLKGGGPTRFIFKPKADLASDIASGSNSPTSPMVDTSIPSDVKPPNCNQYMPVRFSPSDLVVKPLRVSSSRASTVEGQGLYSAVRGIDATFTILARDRYNNRVTVYVPLAQPPIQ